MSARDDLRTKRRRARRNAYWLRIGRDLKAARREGLTLKVYRALNETAYGLQVQLERELMGIPGLIDTPWEWPPVFQGITLTTEPQIASIKLGPMRPPMAWVCDHCGTHVGESESHGCKEMLKP